MACHVDADPIVDDNKYVIEAFARVHAKSKLLILFEVVAKLNASLAMTRLEQGFVWRC